MVTSVKYEKQFSLLYVASDSKNIPMYVMQLQYKNTNVAYALRRVSGEVCADRLTAGYSACQTRGSTILAQPINPFNS
jgi:hypothetical protein